MAFVLLPLPGTGVWGGAVLARLLSLHIATVWLGLSSGVALSGVLWALGATGVFTILRRIF